MVQPGSPGIFRRKSSTAGTEPQQQQVALPASKSRPRPSVGDILATKMAQSGAGATGLGWPNTKEDYDLLEVIGTRTAPTKPQCTSAAPDLRAAGPTTGGQTAAKKPIGARPSPTSASAGAKLQTATRKSAPVGRDTRRHARPMVQNRRPPVRPPARGVTPTHVNHAPLRNLLFIFRQADFHCEVGSFFGPISSPSLVLLLLKRPNWF